MFANRVAYWLTKGYTLDVIASLAYRDCVFAGSVPSQATIDSVMFPLYTPRASGDLRGLVNTQTGMQVTAAETLW